MSEPVKSYPLCWPASWKRTQPGSRVNGRFSKKEWVPSSAPGGSGWHRTKAVTIADAVQRVLKSVSMLGAPDYYVIVSTNVEPRLDGLPRSGKEPNDPGAAVYWRTNEKQPQKCMAIDRYISVADNLAAIAATLEFMRGIERHGGAEILERAFLGFQSLPPPMSAGRPWYEVLGVDPDASLNAAEASYRIRAKDAHPDHNGGSGSDMAELNEAIRQAREVTWRV